MAYIVPSDIGDVALAQAERGELATLNYLKKSLSDQYHVFHSLHWTEAGYSGYVTYGEADFVVVNGAGDVLVIEQKDGSLDETEQGLVKIYGSTRKSVSQQIHRTLDKLRSKYSNLFDGKKLNVDYLFYCPEHTVRNMKAAGLDEVRIVDATSKMNLAERVQSLIKPVEKQDSAGSVLDFLFDTYEIYPDIHTYKDLQTKAFTRLSGGLKKVVSNIEMTPLRLRIKGVAGCGKSQVSRNIYEKAINEKKRPLMVCYNRPLKDKMEQTVPEGGLVETWHGLCDNYLKEQGLKLDYSRVNTDPNFWKELHEQVIETDIPKKWQFSTLIVEEGQDFEPAWFEVLELFLKDDADILWLEDANQNIRNTEQTHLKDFVTYRANENYRTPESIANFIKKVLPYEFECMNPLPGLGVQVTKYKKPDEQPKLVAKLVQSLMKTGFKKDEIVIITMKGLNSSSFSNVDKIGKMGIRKFTGDYDMNGNQLFSDGEIYFETVRRFKGQQAPAVILVDIENNDKERYQNLLFTGMTRATIRMEFVISEK